LLLLLLLLFIFGTINPVRKTNFLNRYNSAADYAASALWVLGACVVIKAENI